MNKAEYSHYHAYQDRKDALDDQISRRADEILSDYWRDSSILHEAIADHLANNEAFLALVLHHKKHHDYAAIGHLFIDTLDDYLADRADQEATDEI